MTRLAKAIVFLSVLTLVALVLAGASSLFSAAVQRSIEYEYFSEAFDLQVDEQSFVVWQPPKEALDRPLSEWEEDKVGLALTDAWRSFGAAMATGTTTYLPENFSGVALDRAQRAAAQAQTDNTRMVVTDISARPVFYHADGSVLQLELTMTTIRYAIGAEGGVGLFTLQTDTTLTTMMNEAAGWRVYSHELRQSDVVSALGQTPVPEVLHGLNYFPSQFPWSEFWANFDSDVTQKDMDRAVSVGANSLRIFLPEADFCGDEAGGNLTKLDAFLTTAAQMGVWVVPTLFDMKSTYDSPRWVADSACLSGILTHLKGHQNIAFVDLKNEPDLDFPTYGRATVEAWLQTMAILAKRNAPDIAVTVGWSTPDEAATLSAALDLVSYHDYQDIAGTGDRLSDVRNLVDDRPVVITEIGASSWGVLFGLPGSPRKQANQLKRRLEGLALANGVFVWTLNDFAKTDAAAIGRRPWVAAKQSAFGLFDVSGEEKPAAQAVRGFFSE